MKLYNESNPAPNPRRVRIFLAEKGMTAELVPVPLRQRAHKAPEFLDKNSLGQIPVLELDDGTFISESVSICRYLEGIQPSPPLCGSDAKEVALIDMWIRRVEWQLMSPIGQVWRHAHPFTAALLTQYKDFGESNRAHAESAYRWLDGEIANRAFIAGESYTLADIVALTTVDFGTFIGVGMPEDCQHLLAWHERVSARESASA